MGEITMRERITLSKEDGCDLIWEGECPGYKIVTECYEITGQGRWNTNKVALVESATTKDMYLLPYSIGSTELQETELFEYDDPILIPAVATSSIRYVADKE